MTRAAKASSFNPLKEKGTPIEKQMRSWQQVAGHPYDKNTVDCYTRARQILMNGVEMESWIFNHNFARMVENDDLKKLLARVRHAEDQQETTINWLAPADQTVLETTLGYEQVAVDLTAYLSQVEDDPYIKQVFDFGLLEDFDHLYRYSQMYDLIENKDPNTIVQGKTDIFPGRPTQDHHNDIVLRMRKFYDKAKASPQTKMNCLTLLSGEQQTHNFYKAHGFMYGNPTLRKLYAEIADVEEEHVSQYEAIIDPTESPFEKWLLHEFMEVCNYYTCMIHETDQRIRGIWEEFLSYEIEHLKLAADIFRIEEDREAEEVIGTEVVQPCVFESQKEYVAKVLRDQVDLRLTENKDWTKTTDLPDDWPSYRHQQIVNADGSPSESVVMLSSTIQGRDIVRAGDELMREEENIVSRGLDKVKSPDTVSPKKMVGAK